MSQPLLAAGGVGPSLDGLPHELVAAIVDRLSPVDAACLALSCRSLREALVLAPERTRVRVTGGAADWLTAPGRLARVSALWLDLAGAAASDGPAARVGAALVAGAAPKLRSLTLSLTADAMLDELPAIALDAYIPRGCTTLRHLAVHGAVPDPGAARGALAALEALVLDTVRTTPLVRPLLTHVRVEGLDLATMTPALTTLALRTAPAQVLGGGAAFVARLRLPPTLTRLEWDRSAWTHAECEPSPASLAAALPALSSLKIVAAPHHSSSIVRDPPPPRARDGFALELAAQASHLMVDALLPWAPALVRLDLTLGQGSELDMTALDAAPGLVSVTLRDARRVRGLPATLTHLALHGNRRRARDVVCVAWPAGGLPALRRLEVAVGGGSVELWTADGAGPLGEAAASAAGDSLTLESYVCVASGSAARAGWPAWLARALARARAPRARSALVPAPTPADLASPHSSPANGVDWPVRVATSGMDGLRGALACAATGLPTHLRMRLFGRFPGDRGIQAAVAALGPIPLSPDEVAAL